MSRVGRPIVVALTVALCAIVAACTTDPLVLEGRRCPCVSGWVCDEPRDICVPDPGGAVDGGAPDAPSPDAGTDGGTDAGSGPDVSCAVAMARGESASGVYPLDPRGTVVDVYCDMTTDGGGWTLVASTLTTMLRDEASPYYADLATLEPADGQTGVWVGLRSLGPRFDLRFACRAGVGAASDPFDVDLSFYDVIWYDEITTGTDAESCFSESDGVGADDPVPARRDNIADVSLPEGDPWNRSGYLEGEDSCADDSDFTVDFDDRGMDGEESDGTDWGEDDRVRKCGLEALLEGQWFIFARER